jgi:hypothetical protein
VVAQNTYLLSDAASAHGAAWSAWGAQEAWLIIDPTIESVRRAAGLPKRPLAAYGLPNGQPWSAVFCKNEVFSTLVETLLDPAWPSCGVGLLTLRPELDGRTNRLAAELSARRDEVQHWDSNEGDAPNDDAFRDAEAFITLIPVGVEEPSIYASGDAEVGFSWTTPDGFVEVAFRGDGNIRYAFRSGSDVDGGITSFRNGGAPRMPSDLNRALQRL